MTQPEPTTQRAEKIRDLTGTAANHLTAAYLKLTEAHNSAQLDYDHNADKLEDIIGAIRLLNSAVTVEHNTWTDYARARKKLDD